MAEEGVPPEVAQLIVALEEAKREQTLLEGRWEDASRTAVAYRRRFEEIQDELEDAQYWRETRRIGKLTRMKAAARLEMDQARTAMIHIRVQVETARAKTAKLANMLRAAEAEAEAAAAAAAAAALKWYEVELPTFPPVIRKEIREMSRAEQERYADAIDKMMETEDGVPGSSQFFRLASFHGGPKTDMWNPVGEYCVHGYEAFPGWHRAYLLEFERCLRRADIALGRDGMIGLPYWGWEDTYINGECFPKILRDRFEAYPTDMFPEGIGGSANDWGDRGLVVPDDRFIAHSLEKDRVAKNAKASLNVAQHWQHACTRSRSSLNTSLESPHNSIHTICRGVMASFQSSFHPVFWLHHNNIDRFYEKYIAMHPDSHREFVQKQRNLARTGGHDRRGVVKQAGFPEGSYGIYKPFKNPNTGSDFHASETFDSFALGFQFDDLPEPASISTRFLTEMPTYAVFPNIVITEMDNSRRLHVFAVNKEAVEDFTAPEEVGAYFEHPAYAGSGAIFGLFPPGGCESCKTRPPFDVTVDITNTLRETGLRKSDAALVVMVENAVEGTLEPLSDTPVPAPELRGPLFDNSALEVFDISVEGDNYGPDVEAMQAFLVTQGYKTNGVVDGVVGQATVEAIKAFQEAAGLKVDGIAGPLTKAQVVAPVFDNIAHISKPEEEDKATFNSGDTVSWSLSDIPGYLDEAAALKELHTAFEIWTPACGVTFEHVAEGGKIQVSFEGQGDGLTIFDGPGGSLAHAAADNPDALAIRFDEEEKWLLQTEGDEHGDDEPGYFKLLPVAIHEVGHLIGLNHSKNAADVMAPYYKATQIALADNDLARCKALYGL